MTGADRTEPAKPIPSALRAPAMSEERVAQLKAQLGPTRFDALLAILMTECRERPERLRNSQMRGDLSGLRAESESLARASLELGALPLGEAARALAASSELPGAAPLIAAVEEAAEATLIAARDLRARTSA